MDDWRDRSACLAPVDPELFFPVDTGRDARRHSTQKARDICWGECPVRLECLQVASDRDERWGVRGGYDMEAEGASLLRRGVRETGAERQEALLLGLRADTADRIASLRGQEAPRPDVARAATLEGAEV